MGGKRSRDKGCRREREMVDRLSGIPGVSAKRVPLSGAAEGFKGDIHTWIAAIGRPMTVEVKARAKAAGWKSVAEWLGDNDFLMLVEDHKDPLVVLPWKVFRELVHGLHCLFEEGINSPAGEE